LGRAGRACECEAQTATFGPTQRSRNTPSAPAAAFLAAYSEKYKHPPSPFAAASYDGVQLWARAVARAGGKTDPESVAAAMIGLNYDGVIGNFKVTKDNHTGLDAAAYKAIVLKNGNWTTM